MLWYNFFSKWLLFDHIYISKICILIDDVGIFSIKRATKSTSMWELFSTLPPSARVFRWNYRLKWPHLKWNNLIQLKIIKVNVKLTLIAEPSGCHTEGSVTQNPVIAGRYQRQILTRITRVSISLKQHHLKLITIKLNTVFTRVDDVWADKVLSTPFHVIAEDQKCRSRVLVSFQSKNQFLIKIILKSMKLPEVIHGFHEVGSVSWTERSVVKL